MLKSLNDKLQYCASGELHIYVVPFRNRLKSGHLPGFFILGRKIMKDQTNTDTNNNNIKKTKADLYESFYDGE